MSNHHTTAKTPNKSGSVMLPHRQKNPETVSHSETSIYDPKNSLSILTEEYKAVRTEINLLLTFQNQIVLILSSLAPAYVAAFLSPTVGKGYLWLLLSIPFLFSLFGMLLVDRDETIISLATYQEQVLKPQLDHLLGSPVLLWHDFRANDYYGTIRKPFSSYKLSKLLVSPFPHFLFIILSVVSIFSVHYLTTNAIQGSIKPIHLSVEQRIIFIADHIFTAYCIISTSFTALKYRHLHEGMKK